MTTKQKKQYDELTTEEKKIYDSVMSNFPSTQHESAIDVAWQGGVNYNFIPK